jgi:hypothetical protein
MPVLDFGFADVVVGGDDEHIEILARVVDGDAVGVYVEPSGADDLGTGEDLVARFVEFGLLLENPDG